MSEECEQGHSRIYRMNSLVVKPLEGNYDCLQCFEKEVKKETFSKVEKIIKDTMKHQWIDDHATAFGKVILKEIGELK